MPVLSRRTYQAMTANWPIRPSVILRPPSAMDSTSVRQKHRVPSVASTGAGRIKPSTILRRLATYSRKSKLYFAFRELGHAVRTGFLLDCLSGIELRRLIQAATNKSERFNQFLQWVSFGGGALAAEGVRDEQRKFIKYIHLVANLLIFRNVVATSKALERLIADDVGSPVPPGDAVTGSRGFKTEFVVDR
jgi:TnpA family transposase